MAIHSLPLALRSRLLWFSVLSLEGKTLSARDICMDRPALIAFLCNHSPYVRHIEKALSQLFDEYMDRVDIVVICSNDERSYPVDNSDGLHLQIERARLSVPYYLDRGQRAAKSFEAICTPEFFVYGTDRRLVYHGQFDSSRPGNHTPPSGNDL